MAELADALDSGSSDFTVIQVQVLLPAPPKSLENTEFSRLFAFLFPLSHGGRGRCVYDIKSTNRNLYHSSFLRIIFSSVRYSSTNPCFRKSVIAGLSIAISS